MGLLPVRIQDEVPFRLLQAFSGAVKNKPVCIVQCFGEAVRANDGMHGARIPVRFVFQAVIPGCNLHDDRHTGGNLRAEPLVPEHFRTGIQVHVVRRMRLEQVPWQPGRFHILIIECEIQDGIGFRGIVHADPGGLADVAFCFPDVPVCEIMNSGHKMFPHSCNWYSTSSFYGTDQDPFYKILLQKRIHHDNRQRRGNGHGRTQSL